MPRVELGRPERGHMPKIEVLPVEEVPHAPPNHICALYDSRDVRDDMIVRFVREGLAQGDKCVCFIDHDRDFMHRLTLDAAASNLMPPQLEFHSADDAYLDNGSFCKEMMIERLARHVACAMNDGYPLTRLVGDMSWIIHNRIDPAMVVAYEAEVNDFARRVPQIAFCLYDLAQFDGSVIVDVLRTHPKIFLNGMILTNPYYVARSSGAVVHR
jgi:hypothetical protein